MTKEEKLKEIEDTVNILSETLIKTAEELNKVQAEHEELKIKFNSFAKAVLSNGDKELSNKIFKEYQKNIFKK